MRTVLKGARTALLCAVVLAVAAFPGAAVSIDLPVTGTVVDTTPLLTALANDTVFIRVPKGIQATLTLPVVSVPVPLTLKVFSVPTPADLSTSYVAGSLTVDERETTSLGITVPTGLNSGPVSTLDVQGLKLEGTMTFRTINLKQVHITGGNIIASTTLGMKSCFVSGGTIRANGTGNTLIRNTFRGGTLTLTAATLNGNLFDGVTPPTANISGINNYDAALADAGTATLFIGRANVFPLGGPAYAGGGGTGSDWVTGGRLRFPLVALNGQTAPTSGGHADFDGTESYNDPDIQIGADQSPGAVPTAHNWSATEVEPINDAVTVLGAEVAAGTATTQALILGPSNGIDLHITLSGLFADVPTNSAYGLVIVPQRLRGNLNDAVTNHATELSPLLPLAQANGTTTANLGVLDFVFEDILVSALANIGATTANPHPFDGLAEIVLVAGGQVLPATPPIEILIDTAPPVIGKIDSTTAFDLASGTNQPPALTCGSYTGQQGIDSLTGGTTAPAVQYLVSSSNLSFTLSLPLGDPAPAGNTTAATAGFMAVRTLTAFGQDPTFGNALLGDAGWNGTLPFTSVGTATASATGAPSTPLQTAIRSWNFVLSGVTPLPEASSWDGHVKAYDLAGNASEEVPVRIWWMPQGSTWASVVAASDSDQDPKFSWNVQMRQASGVSVMPEFGCGWVPKVRYVVMSSDNAPLWDTNGWSSTEDLGWSAFTTDGTIGMTSPAGPAGGGTISDLVQRNLGDTLAIIVQAVDPAGTTQPVLGLDTTPAGPVSTTNTLGNLLNATGFGNPTPIASAGPYFLPTHPREGSLDTMVTAKYFLNRVETNDRLSLWEINGDEVTYGAGPNVPLTPLKACGQRLEADFTIDVGLPDSSMDQYSVEFRLYENGVLVARGNLTQTVPSPITTLHLLVPTDLLNVAMRQDAAGSPNPYNTTVFVPTQHPGNDPYAGPVAADTAKFLNFPPQGCNSDRQDRLGDDGPVTRAGETDPDSQKLKETSRSKPVTYTLWLQTNNRPASSNQYPPDADKIVDASPATISFTVIPDLSPDSEPPRVKTRGSK